MKYLLYIFIVLLLLGSCTKTQYIEKEVPVETVRIEYKNILQYDSIYIHDSIDRFVSGDTLYFTKYKNVYKYLYHTDTIVKIDSIEKPIYITKEVTKITNKLNSLQAFLVWSGIIGWLIGILYLIRKLKK